MSLNKSAVMTSGFTLSPSRLQGTSTGPRGPGHRSPGVRGSGAGASPGRIRLPLLLVGAGLGVMTGCIPRSVTIQLDPVVQAPPPPPTFASVSLVGVTIGPGKSDGSQWDGFFSMPAGLALEVARNMEAPNDYMVTLDLLNRASQGLAKPDIYGETQLLVGGTVASSLVLPLGAEDSFSPTWTHIGWQHVPLDEDVRLRVSLMDEDMTSDDPVGVFELSTADLRAAMNAGTVLQVDVAAQTQQQVLFCAIAVAKESVSTPTIPGPAPLR